MGFPTWNEIDRELDEVEEGDIPAIVLIFLAHRNEVLFVDGERERVTVSSFSRHIDMPRHTFDSWIHTAQRESA